MKHEKYLCSKTSGDKNTSVATELDKSWSIQNDKGRYQVGTYLLMEVVETMEVVEYQETRLVEP